MKLNSACNFLFINYIPIPNFSSKVQMTSNKVHILLSVCRSVERRNKKQLIYFLTVKPVYGCNATGLQMSIIDVAHNECQSLLRNGD